MTAHTSAIRNGHITLLDTKTGVVPCAKVGQFIVIDQIAGYPEMLEIYKQEADGTVRAAAYKGGYERGYEIDEEVTSLAELKAAFGVK